MAAYTISHDSHASAGPRDSAFYQDPYAFYRDLHAVSPTFFWEDYGHWCFAGFKEVNALLRDKRFGRQILHVATREQLGLPEPKPHLAAFDRTEKYSLLNLEPPAHTRLRTLVNRAFVSRHVEQLRPRIERLANELIDGFRGRRRGRAHQGLCRADPGHRHCRDDRPAGRRWRRSWSNWSNRMVTMYMFGVTRETELDANQASRRIHGLSRAASSPSGAGSRGEDLLTHMITAEVDGQKLSDDEIMSTAILLLNAGHEATVHTTGNAVKAILESGIDPKRLFAGEDQTAATVEECLRYDAPLHMFTRYALGRCRARDGRRFKLGDTIGLMLGAANRDPLRFADPDRFDPFRSDGANVSFGAGIHFCIGAPLARIELQVALKVLFERLPKLALAAEPKYRDTYHFHGLERLDVQF